MGKVGPRSARRAISAPPRGSRPNTMDTRVPFEQLCLQYELHPVREVWVEGVRDRQFLEWFLSADDYAVVEVREIDQVAFADSAVVQHGLRPHSSRDRVIAFALDLDTAVTLGAASVLAIADRDRHDRPAPVTRRLAYTDSRDLEGYLLDSRVIKKFLRLACNLKGTAVDILHWFIPLVRSVSAVFDASDALGWGMSPLPLRKYLEVNSSTKVLEFDLAEYKSALLVKNGRSRDRAAFDAEVRARTRTSGADAVHVRGHTFLDLLGTYIAGVANMKGDVARALCESLYCSCELAWLREGALFQRIASEFAVTAIE